LYAGSGTVTSGVPATVYMTTQIGANISAACVIAVPASKKFVGTKIFSSLGDTSKTLNFHFSHYVAALGLWFEILDIHISHAEFILPIEAYPALAAGDVLVVKANVNNGTASATVTLSGYMLDE
jgi:hypothetical protein